MSRLRGSMVALVTPFRNGAVDEPALRALARWQIEKGTDALVPCGTTGEGATLSGNELVLTNASDTYTLQTTLADDELSLRWVSSTEQGTPQDQAKHRRYTIAFYCSAPFRRQP